MNERVSETRVYTRRQFLEYQAVMAGANIFMAKEAVATTAMEHPEWDMDEKMTWQQWRESDAGRAYPRAAR